MVVAVPEKTENVILKRKCTHRHRHIHTHAHTCWHTFRVAWKGIKGRRLAARMDKCWTSKLSLHRGYLWQQIFFLENREICEFVCQNSASAICAKRGFKWRWWSTSLFPTLRKQRWIWGQPALHDKFQASQDYIGPYCFKIKTKVDF